MSDNQNPNNQIPNNQQQVQQPAPAAQQQLQQQVQQQVQQPATPAGSAIEFDYEKLAGIVAGKQTVTEDTVLKGYFKQQGLSKEEMDQAIQTFKTQKAAQQPDPNALQQQLTQAQQAAQQARVESAATVTAISLGVDVKTVPYVLKMTDLTQVIDAEGKVSDEALKNAINKVLEEVPALKPAPQQASGFQLGAPSSNQTQQTTDDQLKKAFGL